MSIDAGKSQGSEDPTRHVKAPDTVHAGFGGDHHEISAAEKAVWDQGKADVRASFNPTKSEKSSVLEFFRTTKGRVLGGVAALAASSVVIYTYNHQDRQLAPERVTYGQDANPGQEPAAPNDVESPVNPPVAPTTETIQQPEVQNDTLFPAGVFNGDTATGYANTKELAGAFVMKRDRLSSLPKDRLDNIVRVDDMLQPRFEYPFNAVADKDLRKEATGVMVDKMFDNSNENGPLANQLTAWAEAGTSNIQFKPSLPFEIMVGPDQSQMVTIGGIFTSGSEAKAYMITMEYKTDSSGNEGYFIASDRQIPVPDTAK